MKRRSLSASLCALVVMLSALSPFTSAARLFLDSRPTDTGPTDRCADLSLRELPRQTLLVIANDDLGCQIVDATLELQAKPQPGDIRMGLSRELPNELDFLKVDLFDAANQQIERFEIPLQMRAPRFVRLDQIAGQLDDEALRSKWRAILAAQLSVTEPKPVKLDANQPVPGGIEQRLNAIDFNNAFMAARLTHEAIAASGASPARLGALVRAYANLGESTRELISGQSPAMFARSYVYAQRLIRLAPQDPMSWYHRAYLQALHGMIPSALEDLKRGDELGGNPTAPAWVGLTRKLLAFDTPGLYRDLQADASPLVSYFAWRTVEHSSLPALVVNFAKAALPQNTRSLRIVNSINGNTGIGYAGQASAVAQQMLVQMIAVTASSSDTPQAVVDLLTPAVQARLATPSALAMLEGLEAVPTETGQMMSWPAYAALIRECQFVNVIRQLSHIAYAIGTDASALAKQAYPLVKDHRYALVVATYDRTNQLAGPDGPQQLHKLQVSDEPVATVWMGFNRHFNYLGVQVEPKRQMNWLAHTTSQSDHTAHDLAHILWIYRNTRESATLTDIRRTTAAELDQMAPNHPEAMAWRIIEDWPAMRQRADLIERDYSDIPMIAYALGQAYVKLKQFDRAAVLLEKAIQFAPDKPVFTQLAETYFARGDYEKWLAIWDRYFRESEDTGLDHGSARRDIAAKLLFLQEFDKALVYAEGAAETGSAWGMDIHAHVLTRLGKYDQAHLIEQGLARRYEPIPYYRWCLETGKGDLPAAAQAMQAFIPQIDRRNDAVQLVDAACYYLGQGDLAKASHFLERSHKQRDEPYITTLLAVLRLQQKRPDEAKKLLDDALKIPAESTRLKAYATGASEIKRFIENPQTAPSKFGEMTRVIADGDNVAARGNIYYMLGKSCELQGKTDAAKMWYRLTLDTASHNFATRGLAGDALRKLGDEYYK